MCQWRAGGEMPQYEEKAETSPDSERRRLCGAWRVLGRRMGVLRGWCWGAALQIFFLALTQPGSRLCNWPELCPVLSLGQEHGGGKALLGPGGGRVLSPPAWEKQR